MDRQIEELSNQLLLKDLNGTAPMQIDDVYAPEIVWPFLESLTPEDMAEFTHLYVTVDPNEPDAGIKILIRTPRDEIPGWASVHQPLPGNHPTAQFVRDKDTIEDEIWEYYQEHKAEYPDIRTIEGQRRFGRASDRRGYSAIIIFPDRYRDFHIERLADAFLYLAIGVKNGALRHQGILSFSFRQFPDQYDARLKVTLRGNAYPDLINDICDITAARGMPINWLKVKSDMAVVLNRRLHDPAIGAEPFRSFKPYFEGSPRQGRAFRQHLNEMI